MAGEFDLEQTDRLLTTTRAVRKRLDLTRPVEREVVLDCLRLATQAPSGGNRQRWRWIDRARPSQEEGVAERYAQVVRGLHRSPAGRARRRRTPCIRRMVESSRHLADHMADMPLLVIPCTLDRLAPDATGEASPASTVASSRPIWSFQLALRSRGLGSALTTLHLEYEREIGEVLGIPDTVTQVALLPVGLLPRRGLPAGAAATGRGDHVLATRWKAARGDAMCN